MTIREVSAGASFWLYASYKDAEGNLLPLEDYDVAGAVCEKKTGAVLSVLVAENLPEGGRRRLYAVSTAHWPAGVLTWNVSYTMRSDGRVINTQIGELCCKVPPTTAALLAQGD